MTHRHVIGETLASYFVAQHCSDQTEGRGGNIDVGVFENHLDAYKRIRGEGVQGIGDGDVIQRTFSRCEECVEILITNEKVYSGVHGASWWTRPNNFATDGWRKDLSPLMTDPDYPKYLELKARFEK